MRTLCREGFDLFGKIFVCKIIKLCSLFKFCASKQIWNSAFSCLPKHGLEKDGIFREMNDLPSRETVFRTVVKTYTNQTTSETVAERFSYVLMPCLCSYNLLSSKLCAISLVKFS